MVQPTCLVALRELKTIPAPEDQLELLRLLKNDIVGHGQRKELVVRHGLLDPLAQILLSTTKATGKKVSLPSTSQLDQPAPLSLEHDIRLQATLIVGSLANAGPAFVPPILSNNLLQALLQALVPADFPSKIVVATLRTLSNVASACASLAFASPNCTDVSFADRILTKSTVNGLFAILQQDASTLSPALQQQVALAADLVFHCCVSEAARNLLVKEGVLDALADIVASFALSHTASASPSNDARPTLRGVLNALSAIIEGSNYRAHRLIYSASLRKVLATSKERSFFDDSQGPNFSQHTRASHVVSVEHLLPKIVVQKYGNYGSQSFPALAPATSRLLTDPSATDSASPSPLCVWLIHLSRSQSVPSGRLAALRLLALVSNALDADAGGSRPELVPRFKERERQVALLAVPIAVKLVTALVDQGYDPSEAMAVRIEACSVLASLINNNVELQKAAHTADAHKYVSQILRRSFEPVTLARPMWSPQSPQPATSDLSTVSPSTVLGHAGLPQEVVQALKCRAGALEAVAAISDREDTIRKDLIEAGVAAFIIESLAPFPDSALSTTSTYHAKDGNTVAVLLAACKAATAMSRSVGNLRTSLIDAGLGKPVFALLKHPNNDVQIAATNVSINLVLDFSPMREDLIGAGVIQIFCTHAKTSSPKLRQASLWGLKHLVLNAPQPIKHTCLGELGSGWLIQAINGDQFEAHNPSLGMSTSNAQGEQVDLLNAESPEMDVDLVEDRDSDDDDGEVSIDQNGMQYQSSGIRSTLKPASYKARLRIFREQEFDPILQAKQDDIEIQEQALDFIRNLINGDDNVQMIDHLNNTIGGHRIFDMLYNKLKPAVAPAVSMHGLGLNQRQTSLQSSTATPTWQPTTLVRAALGVLIHLAAGSSRHRQQLVAQKQLLTVWLPHFSHPDRQVRVSSVWGVINLTWPETAGDREDARRRARELRDVGIEDRVRGLVNDADLDVRERVKTAIRQIDELLENGRHR
ncbi:armadillo-type protein [Delphinella strobiligena]|nr:armadillo-type protein [Delphinella strobiligena]